MPAPRAPRATPRRSPRAASPSRLARAGRARGESGSGKPFEELDLHLLARFYGTALVLEHDEAVRFRHRAQHARALLARGAHAPVIVFAEQNPALVFGAARHLPEVLRRDGL